MIYRVSPEERKAIRGAKIVYGVGHGARGVTYYEAWQNGERHCFVEICASGEENPTQLAGTTIHELGHVISGHGHGHDTTWKENCRRLGLTTAMAAGQAYRPEDFDKALWERIEELSRPVDGMPLFGVGLGLGGILGPGFRLPRIIGPCKMGRGVRGGKSAGPGSGSRMRLYECGCVPKPFKVRCASDDLQATCKLCGKDFARVEKPAVPTEVVKPGGGAGEPVEVKQ